MLAYRTPILLALAALLLGGASYYTTDVYQKDRIATLKESRRAAELLNARVDELLAQESVSAEAAEAALSRWHSRYKYIPAAMNTADIVEYLEGLTRVGFEAFDLRLAGQSSGQDVSKYTFEVKGDGDYGALYHLVWHLENNREFYRINDLQMDHVEITEEGRRPRDMVSFSFSLDAYFSDLDGLSAPEDDLRPIPVGLLLPHRTDTDIFRPLVRVPKNAPTTRVDAPEVAGPQTAAAPAPGAGTPQAAPARAVPLYEGATLRGIVGGWAIFDLGNDEQVRAQEGDEVLGGEVVSLDPQNGVVTLKVTEEGRERTVALRLGQPAVRR